MAAKNRYAIQIRTANGLQWFDGWERSTRGVEVLKMNWVVRKGPLTTGEPMYIAYDRLEDAERAAFEIVMKRPILIGNVSVVSL